MLEKVHMISEIQFIDSHTKILKNTVQKAITMLRRNNTNHSAGTKVRVKVH